MSHQSMLLACVASLTFFLIGYDFVMPNIAPLIREKLGFTHYKSNWLVHIVDMGGFAGAVIGGSIASVIGRRYTVMVAGVLFFLGYSAMLSAIHYMVLMVGRVFIGLGSGISIVITPIYIAEIIPSSSRASHFLFPELFLCIGDLYGVISYFFLSSLQNKMRTWRLMMGLGVIPSLVLVIGIAFMPESPTWLFMQNKRPEAIGVMLLTKNDFEKDVNERLQTMDSAARRATSNNVGYGALGKWSALCIPLFRDTTISIVAFHFCQQASAMEIVMKYSQAFLGFVVSLKPWHEAVVPAVIICIRVCVLLFVYFFWVRVRRRLVVGVSFIVTVISLGLMGVIFLLYQANVLGDLTAVIVSGCCVFFFTVAFSVVIGPQTWLYGIELLPYKLREKNLSVGAMTNRMTRGCLYLFMLPSAFKSLQYGGFFFILAGFLVIGGIQCYKYFNESNVCKLEEIDVRVLEKINAIT